MQDPITFYQEIFAEFGAVTARRMFGGLGIYHQGIMFAIVFDDVLYLKCNEVNAHVFLSRGLQRFTYSKGGRNIPLSYYQAPDEIVDDPQEAAAWARRAFETAMADNAGRRLEKRPRNRRRPSAATSKKPGRRR